MKALSVNAVIVPKLRLGIAPEVLDAIDVLTFALSELFVVIDPQMEVYQWLLRKRGLTVSDTGYFVYCNGKSDNKAFDKKLEFDVTLIPYTGNDGWVERAVVDAHTCLTSKKIPKAGDGCDYCSYIAAINKFNS